MRIVRWFFILVLLGVIVVLAAVGLDMYSKGKFLSGGPYANLRFGKDGEITNAPRITDEMRAYCDKDLFTIYRKPVPVAGFSISRPTSGTYYPWALRRGFDYVEVDYTPDSSGSDHFEDGIIPEDYGKYRMTRHLIEEGKCTRAFMKAERERRSRRVPEPRTHCIAAEKIDAFTSRYQYSFVERRDLVQSPGTIFIEARYFITDTKTNETVAESLSYIAGSTAWREVLCRGPRGTDFIKQVLTPIEK